ncbi:hypothetical protein JHK87_033606 [Glycine soja]|nr:hypothetical protein JHK87_033606 [Glycine soja]
MDSKCAELFAIYQGLKQSWELGFRHITCEYDFLSSLDLIYIEGIAWFSPSSTASGIWQPRNGTLLSSTPLEKPTNVLIGWPNMELLLHLFVKFGSLTHVS